MFGNKKNKKEATTEKKMSGRNVISSGTKIVGDLISQGDFRIDGTLEGSLKTDGRVVIGKNGFIKEILFVLMQMLKEDFLASF